MTSSLITFNLTNFDEFSTDLIDFLSEIGQHFQSRIDGLLEKRKVKKATLDEFKNVEDIVQFLTENAPNGRSYIEYGKRATEIAANSSILSK